MIADMTDATVGAQVTPGMAEAVGIVLAELVDHAKPKAVAKAKAALLHHAERLETWHGCRLPAGVVSMGEWRQSRASAAQRQERAEIAAAIRRLVAAL